MTRLISWLLALAVGVVPLLVGVPAAAAAGFPSLDGMALRYLPPGLGASTDFAYEYDEVAFAARVWESGSDADGWRVDLDVQTMRGDRLNSRAALHDWFLEFEERGPARYRAVLIRGHNGWMSDDEVFWLVRPGLAVSVLIDGTRWTQRELLRIARGVRAP
jgi:hypothetical protein